MAKIMAERQLAQGSSGSLVEGEAKEVVAMRPETRYAKSGDVHIAYQVVGEGPIDLVLVYGWISHIEHQWEDHRSLDF
jgi:hypothetical protein